MGGNVFADCLQILFRLNDFILNVEMQLGLKMACKKCHISVPVSRGKQPIFENEFIADT